MKKKNIIGRMTAPKENVGGWFRRTQLIPRLLCLLLAVLIWLTVENLNRKTRNAEPDAMDDITWEEPAE